MAKYRIWCRLTSHHGEAEQEIEAPSAEQAEDAAYEMLLEELDSEAAWGAEELSEAAEVCERTMEKSDENS